MPGTFTFEQMEALFDKKLTSVESKLEAHDASLEKVNSGIGV